MEKLFKSLKRVHVLVWWILGIVILIRLALPVGIKYGINWYLDKKMLAYQGHIDDFDLSLWRGAYQIEGLKIWKRGADPTYPLVAARNMDLSLAWRAFWKRHLLGDLRIEGLNLQFIDSASEKKKQFGTEEKNWNKVANVLVPIDIESLKIEDSVIHFVNRDFKVPVDVYMDQIFVDAANLRNIDDKKELLPSRATATGRILSQAPFKLQGKFNLLRNPLALDVQAELKNLHLKKLNPFFLTYGPFSFDSGDFAFYSEVATTQNKIKGYIKPFFESVKFVSSQEDFVSFRHRLNEYLLGTSNFILRNSEKTTATKLEFEGDLQSPDVRRWHALWISLKNAFGKPLQESIEKSIDIRNVPK